MLDFNSKKEILGRLRRKGQKNIFMFVPCTIAAFFVKAWYAFICRADMALSDKNGDLLGIKGLGKKEKDRSRKDDIVYVRKPFLGRFVSAVLAMSLTMMLMPAVDLGLGIDAGAVIVPKIDSNMVELEPGLYYDKTEWDGVSKPEITFVSQVIGNGDAKIFWKVGGSCSIDNYKVDLINKNTGAVETGTQNGNITSLLIQDKSPEIPYKVIVTAIKNVPLYNKLEPDLDIKPPRVSVQWDLLETSLPIPCDVPVEFDLGILQASMSSPDIQEIVYDEASNDVAIRWNISHMESDPSQLAEGYVVYRSEVNTTDSGTGKEVEMISAPVTDPAFYVDRENGVVEWHDTSAIQGMIYEYYILAYRDVFGESKGYYVADKAGMVDRKGRSKRLTTLPTSPFDVSVTSNGKNALIVKWTKGKGNADGFYVYRSEGEEITQADAEAHGYSSFAEYIIDSRVSGTKRVDNENATSADQYSFTDNDEELINTNTYWYYVIAYVKVDNVSNTQLYSSPGYSFGMINAQINVPTGLKPTSYDGRVEVTWNSVSNADGYYLYITKLRDSEGRTIPEEERKTEVIDWHTNSYTHTTFDGFDLLNNEMYSYEVAAYINVTVNDDPTDPNRHRKVSDKCMPRNAEVGIDVTSIEDVVATPKDGAIDVTWTEVPGATGYEVTYWKEGQQFFPTTVERSGTLFEHKNLKNGEVYYYYVTPYKTVNGVKDYGPSSTTIHATVGVPLAKPQDVTVETEDGETTVDWSDVDGAEGYILQYRRPGESWADYKDSSDLHNVDLSEPGFNHTRLNNGDTYEYRVIAYKTVSGERVYSEPSIIVSIKVGDILDAPKDFAVTTTDGTANLTWTESDGAEGYMVYAYSAKDRRMYSYDVSQPGYNHTNLINGDTWIYYVVAYKTVNGERTYSPPTISISVNIGVSMTAAVDLTATPGNRQVVLNWSAVTGAQGYVVYLYNEVTMEYDPITVTSQTTYTHLGLTNGKNYRYMVAAYKDIGGERVYGEYSMPVTATPTTGSLTDIDRDLTIKGTAPYGISHGEYISASANHGAFDESVDVYFTTSTEATQTVRDVLKSFAGGLNSFIIYPFDISVYSENTKVAILPNNGYNVTITMPIPDRLIAYRDYISIVHIDEYADEETIEEDDITVSRERRLEVLPSAVLDIDNVWCVQFETSSFSPYAMVIYKDHISDIASGGGSFGGLFAGSFNSGVLLFTALPDIMPNNNKLRIVSGGQKRYRIKSIEKLTK